MTSNNSSYFSPNQSVYDESAYNFSSAGGSSSSGKRRRPPSEKKLKAQAAAAEAAAMAFARAEAALSRQSNQPQTDGGDVVLPVSRIRTIMKSSPDVVQIGHESLIIMSKATEYFIQHLAQESFERRSSADEVEYRDLAAYIQENHGGTEFLNEIIPHKIKVRDLAALLAKSHGGDEGDQQEDDEADYSA